MPTTTRRSKDSQPTLYMSMELGLDQWKLGFGVALGHAPRERSVAGGHLAGVMDEIAAAKRRFGLPAKARVVSCYEAGRDGFYIHRYLLSQGVESLVVDSASIKISRRRKQAKSDRLDLGELLEQLMQHDAGAKRVWSVVNVPSEEVEDARHLHRELTTAKRDRTRLTNRIKGLLANQGLHMELSEGWLQRLDTRRLWNGHQVGAHLRARLAREWNKVEVLNEQIKTLSAERREKIRSGTDRISKIARQLVTLCGLGSNSAWIYSAEFFSWRQFKNRRQVGSLAGLTPTPKDSGGQTREQGIGKDGNRHVRAMAIEIAWCWLRYQPNSALSRWYQRRFGGGGSRTRRIGIVALARKLLVSLWRYVETGALPDGAVVKSQLRIA